MSSDTINTVDRFRGCLLGGAVGDSVGAAVEFDDIAAIRRRFGPAGIQDPAAAYGRVGAITDDTQLTLFTAEGLLQADDRKDKGIGLSPAMIVYQAYQRWLRTQGEQSLGGELADWVNVGELQRIGELRSRRAPGLTCLAALRQGSAVLREQAASATGTLPYMVADNASKGCGGVMRAAPCGLLDPSVPSWEPTAWSAGRDPAAAFSSGVQVAALTHGHPSGYFAAGALAVIVYELSHGGSLLAAIDTALANLHAHPDAGEVTAALARARDLGIGDVQPDVSQLGEGWVAEEALAIGVYSALAHETDLAAGVRLAANHSGDSDSTAAITGNILGTHLGVAAIPAGWLAALELRDTIDRLAIALHDRAVLQRHELDWQRWRIDEHNEAAWPAPPHDSYWVIPGRLLAGPYPGDKDGRSAERNLNDFLDTGVTCFIDLTEAGELRPYAPRLRTLAVQRDIEVEHHRMPIRDNDVPTREHMRAVQDRIAAALDIGHIAYVHCWGGVGRTGTVISCRLIETDDLDGTAAIARLVELRRGTTRARRQSPETLTQQAFVLDWEQPAAAERHRPVRASMTEIAPGPQVLPPPSPRRVEVCPHCGQKNRVVPSRAMRCGRCKLTFRTGPALPATRAPTRSPAPHAARQTQEAAHEPKPRQCHSRLGATQSKRTPSEESSIASYEPTYVERDLPMVFPTRDEIRKALLLALADGDSHDSDDVEIAVAGILGLSDNQRRARAGNGTRLGNEINWIKGAGDMGLGLFERVGPKLYRLTPYGRSAAAGDIDPDATRTIHGRVGSQPADLEERLDEDAETLRHDPNNIAALNRTARRFLERAETERAIETFERVLAIDPRNSIAAGRLRQLRR